MGDLCTLADVEAFLQISIPVERQASGTRAIAEASGAIRNYCQQVLELVEDDEITLDVGAGRRRLLLPELPVVAVSQVVEDGEELVEGEDYKLGQYGILHRLERPWAEGVGVVTVTYSHGYDPLPEELVGVCARAAARAYQAGLRADSQDGVPGVQAETLGDYSVTFGSEAAGGTAATLGASAAPILLRSEKEILDKYTP